MAELTIGGRSYKTGRFALAQLDAAADAIDRAQPMAVELQALAEAKKQPTARFIADFTKLALQVVHVGLGRTHPDVTLEDLYDTVTLRDFGSVFACFSAIMQEAEMEEGEPRAPTGAPRRRSKSKSAA